MHTPQTLILFLALAIQEGGGEHSPLLQRQFSSSHFKVQVLPTQLKTLSAL